jgi:hypothetical protein
VVAARDRSQRSYVRHERKEWREHERWERRYARTGFFDGYGRWHWY